MSRSFTWTRRHWLQAAALGIGGVASFFLAPGPGGRCGRASGAKKSVILLWLAGGPATIDLWDLKPGNENGGPFQEIETAVPGLRISEHLPQLAGCANDMVLVRSMTSKEGDHGRATHLVKTGYKPQGAIQFPALGALVAHELVARAVQSAGLRQHRRRTQRDRVGGRLSRAAF